MESSNPSPAVPPVTAMSLATPPGARRRTLAGFGATGLLALAVLLFWVLAALVGPWFLSQTGAGVDSSAQVFGAISAAHWLGTDYLGRDILARVIEGARYTVGVALMATLLASGTGTVLALLAAASGRWIDAAAWTR